MVSGVEVTKNQNETNANLVRRFSRRMQGAKVLNKVRSLRFFGRPSSKLKKKGRALKRIAKKKEIDRLKKLGKI